MNFFAFLKIIINNLYSLYLIYLIKILIIILINVNSYKLNIKVGIIRQQI